MKLTDIYIGKTFAISGEIIADPPVIKTLWNFVMKDAILYFWKAELMHQSNNHTINKSLGIKILRMFSYCFFKCA